MPNQNDEPVDTGPADALEKFLMPTLFGPWAAEVVERAAPQPGERLLDVGCGTGAAARFAAERLGSSGRVVGLDIDAGMLEVAKRCAERDGHQIDWHKGDVIELPFDDQEFDLVVCCQGLQFFPDKATALGEMHRVLKPEGRLIASVWRDVRCCPGHLALARALADLNGTEPAPMPPFSLANADDIRSLAATAGYRNVNVAALRKISPFASVNEFVDALAGGAPSTRRALESLDQDKIDAVIISVTEMLQEYTNEQGLQLPMESHILTAEA